MGARFFDAVTWNGITPTAEDVERCARYIRDEVSMWGLSLEAAEADRSTATKSHLSLRQAIGSNVHADLLLDEVQEVSVYLVLGAWIAGEVSVRS